MLPALLFLLALILLMAIGVHHFVKARRALRTGLVEPLMLGFTRKQYSRESDPAAFWANVSGGFVAAILAIFVALWLILIIGSMISAYEGQPTL